MASKKFYAVKIGLEPGIYETWDECQKNILGYKGALYKSFKSKIEAEKYLEEENIQNNDIKAIEHIDYDLLISNNLKDGRIVAFTDGGWSSKEKVAGYGIYILESNGNVPIEISDVVKTDKFESSNNIAPEVMAVTTAFDWAISNQYEKITIYHDYEGIGKWGKREWLAKSEIAKWFVGRLDSLYNNVLDIEYVWVPGHSNIQYNEEADRLATEAINRNIKPHFKMNETYFSCNNVGEKEVIQIIDLIEKVPEIKIEREINNNHCIYKLRYDKERLTIKFYRMKSLTLVQGKPNSLFSLFISYYTEKISDFDLVKAYADMHKKRINKKDVDDLTKNLNLPCDFPLDAIKLIKQGLSEKIALSSKQNNAKEYDYSHYIFPLCRALEGTIKYMFEKNGIHIESKQFIGSYFQKDSNDCFTLKNEKHNYLKYKTKLEDSYNAYYRIRNVLGHFGELLNSDVYDSNTMLISKPKDAIDTMDEILEALQFD